MFFPSLRGLLKWLAIKIKVHQERVRAVAAQVVILKMTQSVLQRLGKKADKIATAVIVSRSKICRRKWISFRYLSEKRLFHLIHTDVFRSSIGGTNMILKATR